MCERQPIETAPKDRRIIVFDPNICIDVPILAEWFEPEPHPEWDTGPAGFYACDIYKEFWPVVMDGPLSPTQWIPSPEQSIATEDDHEQEDKGVTGLTLEDLRKGSQQLAAALQKASLDKPTSLP